MATYQSPPLIPQGPAWDRWKQQQGMQFGQQYGTQPGIDSSGAARNVNQGSVTPRGGWGAYGGLNPSRPTGGSPANPAGAGSGGISGGTGGYQAPVKPPGPIGQQQPEQQFPTPGGGGSPLMGGDNPFLRQSFTGGLGSTGTEGMNPQTIALSMPSQGKPQGRTGGGTITQQAGVPTFDTNYGGKQGQGRVSSPAQQLQAQGRPGGTGNDIKQGPLHQQGIGGYRAMPRENLGDLQIANGNMGSTSIPNVRPVENQQRRNQIFSGALQQNERGQFTRPEGPSAARQNPAINPMSAPPQPLSPGITSQSQPAQAPAWQSRTAIPPHLQRPGPTPPPAPVTGSQYQGGQVRGQMGDIAGADTSQSSNPYVANQFNPSYTAGPQQQSNVNYGTYNPALRPPASSGQNSGQATPTATRPPLVPPSQQQGSAAPGGGGVSPSPTTPAAAPAQSGIPGPPPGFPTDGMAQVSSSIDAKTPIYDNGLTQRMVNQAVAQARQKGHARTALKRGMGRGLSIDEGQVAGFALPVSAQARSMANQAMANIPLQNEFANRQHQLQGESARGQEAIGLANALRQIHQTNEEDDIGRQRLGIQQMMNQMQLISPLFANLLGGLS